MKNIEFMKKHSFLLATERDQLSIKRGRTVEWLNETINEHMKLLKQCSDRKHIMKLFQLISEYSCKHVGISWLSNKTMAKSIGVSKRSIQRYTSELEQLNVIKKLPTARDNGKGQTSNTYVILPKITKTHNIKVCHGGCHPKETIFENLKQDNKYIDSSKIFQLIEWKLNDKNITHGSAYVEKVINTLFDYAKNLLTSEERQQKVQAVLEKYGNTANSVQKPNYDWLEAPQYKSPLDKWLNS